MVVSSSTPARLPSEPIMLQLSIILLISHRNQKKRAKTWGETPQIVVVPEQRRKPPLFVANVEELMVLQPSVDWMMMEGGDDVLCAKMVAKFFLIKFICVLLPKLKIHILIFQYLSVRPSENGIILGTDTSAQYSCQQYAYITASSTSTRIFDPD